MDYVDEKVTVIREGQRPKRLRKDTKYRREFSRYLLSGARFKEGLSVAELCSKWRISTNTFQDWLKSIPEFERAYTISKADIAAYWHKTYRDITTGDLKGNAGCAIFAMTNIEGINWASKVDVNTTNEQSIGTININILEAPVRALKHDTGNVIEGEIIEVLPDNVVKLHDN